MNQAELGSIYDHHPLDRSVGTLPFGTPYVDVLAELAHRDCYAVIDGDARLYRLYPNRRLRLATVDGRRVA